MPARVFGGLHSLVRRSIIRQRPDVLMGRVSHNLTTGSNNVMAARLLMAIRNCRGDTFGISIPEYPDRIDVSQ